MIKVRTVNPVGIREIGEFLGVRFKKAVNSGKGAGDFDSSMLAAWAADAEFQLDEGNPPVIEIKHWDSISGATETFEVSPEGVDTRYWDDDGNEVSQADYEKAMELEK